MVSSKGWKIYNQCLMFYVPFSLLADREIDCEGNVRGHERKANETKKR